MYQTLDAKVATCLLQIETGIFLHAFLASELARCSILPVIH